MKNDIPISSTKALIDFFSNKLPQLPSSYTWKVPALDGFDIASEAANFGIEHTSNADENIILKKYLNNRWRIADRHERENLAHWIVYSWGGVRANKAETLSSYVDLAETDSPTTPINGVASYSKILSIVDLKKYAIYDARVAACLNAVQYSAGVKDGLAFNYVPGRNSVIAGSEARPGFTRVQAFKTASLAKSGWQRVPRSDTYSTYLALLQACSSVLNNEPIYRLEMTLFALAEIECARAMALASPDYVPPQKLPL